MANNNVSQLLIKLKSLVEDRILAMTTPESESYFLLAHRQSDEIFADLYGLLAFLALIDEEEEPYVEA